MRPEQRVNNNVTVNSKAGGRGHHGYSSGKSVETEEGGLQMEGEKEVWGWNPGKSFHIS